MEMASPEREISAKNETLVHKTIKKVTADIDDLKLNTAIAALMAMVNEFYVSGLSLGDLKVLIQMLSPFAPHIAEEMWEMTGGEGFASLAAWPAYDEAKCVDSEIEIAVQISGKLRATIVIPADADRDAAIAAAKANDKIVAALEGKNIIKEIYVPGKIVNIVAK